MGKRGFGIADFRFLLSVFCFPNVCFCDADFCSLLSKFLLYLWMKLLHVISSMDPRNGGPCQGIRNLHPVVVASGGSVEVVCLDDAQTEYLKTEGIKVHALGQGRSAWQYHPALRPWLEQNLSRFDAVILNGLWQYPGYLLSRLKAQNPKLPPYFVFPHGMLDPWFQRAKSRRLKAIRNWFYWKFAEQHVIRHADALFFTCAEELRLARETFRPYQPQREINVGYGVAAPPQFHERMTAAFAAKCPELGNRPYLLFLSRIHPKKGIDLLIRAYASVYANSQLLSPNSNLPVPALVIAGPGLDTDYGRLIQRLAQELCGGKVESREQKTESGKQTADISSQSSEVSGTAKIESGNQKVEMAAAHDPKFPLSTFNFQLSKTAPAVLFPGMLTGDAKWGALYGCDAFALPSHQENFGIAVAEALACGKPVLISNQVNIWREIETAGGGLVAADDLPGTEQSLQRWKELNPTDRATMGARAFDCYTTKFSVVESGKTFVQTLRQLLAPS